jgi:hypothetical protein
MREVSINNQKYYVEDSDLKLVNPEELVYLENKLYLVKQNKLRKLTKTPESGDIWKSDLFLVCVVRPFYDEDFWFVLGLNGELLPFSDTRKLSSSELNEWLVSRGYQFYRRLSLG